VHVPFTVELIFIACKVPRLLSLPCFKILPPATITTPNPVSSKLIFFQGDSNATVSAASLVIVNISISVLEPMTVQDLYLSAGTNDCART